MSSHATHRRVGVSILAFFPAILVCAWNSPATANIYRWDNGDLITEKDAALQAQGKYVFEVAGGANKPQIKQAVERAFKVKVTAVNVMAVRGKTRRVGKQQVLTQSWKKAVVTLKSGDKIELFEGV